MTKKKITAAELMARLNADPNFVAQRARAEEDHLSRDAEYRLSEMALVGELRAVGFNLQSVWDLVNSSESYSEALPILLSHLPRPYPAAVKEGIARALAVPGAKAVGWDVLIRHYVDEPEDRVRSGLAAAIAAAADDEVISDVIALVEEPRHGSSRLLLLSALERSVDPRARSALIRLAADPELEKEVSVISRRLQRRSRA